MPKYDRPDPRTTFLAFNIFSLGRQLSIPTERKFIHRKCDFKSHHRGMVKAERSIVEAISEIQYRHFTVLFNVRSLIDRISKEKQYGVNGQTSSHFRRT